MIKRSASFDTIATSYLCGEWPRSSIDLSVAKASPVSIWQYHHSPHDLMGDPCCQKMHHLNLMSSSAPTALISDKWTQTMEDVEDVDSDSLKRRTIYSRWNSATSNDIRSRLTKLSSAPGGGGSPTRLNRCSPLLTCAQAGLVCGGAGGQTNTAYVRSKAIAIPVVYRHDPLSTCQGSAEGFNQEIERLVRSTGILTDCDHHLNRACVATPEGHHAPIADLLNMRRSVDTQTPSSGVLGGAGPYYVDKHFLRIAEDCNDDECRSQSDESPSLRFSSVSELVEDRPESETGRSDSASKSADEMSSPGPLLHFVKSSHNRQPPEGCERVEVKMAVEVFKQDASNLSQDGHPTAVITSPVKSVGSLRCHIPSERSAFCPLLKNYVNQQSATAALLSFSLTAGNSAAVASRIEAL